jgi:hypothetical protein
MELSGAYENMKIDTKIKKTEVIAELHPFQFIVAQKL